jgi:TetR/AcrR family transcriptional regulator, regulator of cefoperazone and chloramphenicol sensitivity
MNPASPPPGAASAADKPLEDARHRLLTAGLQLFAQQGFAKTSTRELAEAASVNVAAISYYFGDKAGLYRAVFFEPLGGDASADVAAITAEGLSLEGALRAFYAGFLAPLHEGEAVTLCMKLHFRELLEPTGLWDDHLAHGIRPVHEAMLQVLQQHLGLAEVDDELQRLAISLAALGVHLYVGRDCNDRLAPGLFDTPAQLDAWAERLTLFGLAMVHAEARRRGLRLADGREG